MRLFADMREGGVQPNLITFNALLAACAAEAQWQAALQVFRYMSAGAGVTPDEVTYSCVIEALAKSGKWRTAVGLYREAAASTPPQGIFANFPRSFDERGLSVGKMTMISPCHGTSAFSPLTSPLAVS